MIDRTAEIKTCLTIDRVGAAVFPGWAPAKSCKSPFRQDRTPSFSVFDSGRAWKDHATNEGGDVVSFYMKATGLQFTDALDRLGAMAGVYPDAPAREPEPKRVLRLPDDLHEGAAEELVTVAKLRGINPEATAEASERGLLKFSTVGWFSCWLLLDQSGKSAQARRMDGKPFPSIGSLTERKAHTLKGSGQAWPLGLLEAAEKPSIAIVEGGADLMSAIHFAQTEGKADQVGFVTMLGASNSIPDDALIHFKNKRVRIFAHGDDAGRKAAIKWKSQLQTVHALVDIFDCGDVPMNSGKVSGDLNDIADIDADFWEDNRALMDNLFDFARAE